MAYGFGVSNSTVVTDHIRSLTSTCGKNRSIGKLAFLQGRDHKPSMSARLTTEYWNREEQDMDMDWTCNGTEHLDRAHRDRHSS